MKLPKFIRWMMLNPVTLITNIVRVKEIKREKFLMNEYKSKRILQVDNDTDNKKYLLSLECI